MRTRDSLLRGAALASIVLAVSGCGGGGGDPDPIVITTNFIEYKVTGTAASASMTYSNSSGTVQVTAPLPWSGPFPLLAKPGDFLYLSAQNQGRTGTVTVTISTAGKVLATNTSSGEFSIATASKSCC